MATSFSDDKQPRPAPAKTSGARPHAGGTTADGRPALRIVTDDPEELAAYAEAQRITRAKGMGAEPLEAHAPAPVNPLLSAQYTASLPAFLNTDRVRDQVARHVPDSAWQEAFPVDPSLTSLGDGYLYSSQSPEQEAPRQIEEIDESELVAHEALRSERRAERRRRAAEQSRSGRSDDASISAANALASARRTAGGAYAGKHAAPSDKEQRRAAARRAGGTDAGGASPGDSLAGAGTSQELVASASKTGRHAAPASSGTLSASLTGKHAAPPSKSGAFYTGRHAAVEADATEAKASGSVDQDDGLTVVFEASPQETASGFAVVSQSSNGLAPMESLKRRAAAAAELAYSVRDRAVADPTHAWQIVLVCAAVLIALIASVWMLYFPAQRLYLAIRENERLVDELQLNYARNDLMQRRVDYLQTEEGIQDEAHRVYGYIMPGENAVSVTGVEVSNPYAGSTTVGGIERGSGENTHTFATDVLDRIFGVEASPKAATVDGRVAITEDPVAVNPDADIVAD